MEPEIQYAKTADGVSVAFWVVGDGPPLLFLPPMAGHVGLDWHGAFGPDFQSLARRYRLIRIDGRDSGLSQRTGNGFTIESFALDVEAVADLLGIDAFAIYANGPSGLYAIAFAAQRPARVSALILGECFASFAELGESSRIQALLALLDRDYELYTETMASLFFGWAANDVARQYAEHLRASQTHDEARAAVTKTLDVSHMLELVSARTLVMHHRDSTLVPVELARDLASRIRNARLVVLEGDTVTGQRADPEQAAVIDQFLFGREAPAAPPAARAAGTVVILFADIVGSTRLTEELGDAAFRAKARDLDASLRALIREAGGSPVDGAVLGDGVMAVFGSAAQAVACAVRCEAAAAPAGLSLHLGIHAGDVISEGNNVYGGTVNVAARIAGESRPGEILVSDVVRALARTSAGVIFDDRGEVTLRGVAEPQRLWAVPSRDT